MCSPTASCWAAKAARLEAFYAPLHGVTANARIVIVGLTPGLS